MFITQRAPVIVGQPMFSVNQPSSLESQQNQQDTHIGRKRHQADQYDGAKRVCHKPLYNKDDMVPWNEQNAGSSAESTISGALWYSQQESQQPVSPQSIPMTRPASSGSIYCEVESYIAEGYGMNDHYYYDEAVVNYYSMYDCDEEPEVDEDLVMHD